MNLLYTLAWRGVAAETNARDLYQQLRAATVRGERIPFDCPYEVALANQRSTDGEWVVAILVMCGGILGDAERTETIVRLEDWFARCGAAGMRGGQTKPADHLKVASELGLGYAVVESFGTFVGEPEDADQKKPEPKLVSAVEKSDPAAVKPAGEPVIGPEMTAPPTAKEVIAAASRSANGCASWGGGIAIAAGVIIGLAGLLAALLVVIVQFTEESPASDLSDFFLVMACFPLPMLIFAAVMIGVGVFVLRRARKQTAAALSLS